MRGAVATVAGWAAFVTLLATGLAVWSPWDWLGWSVFAAAAGGAWLLGLAVALGTRRPRADVVVVPELSLPTVAVALGAAFALAGVLFGYWAALIGGGLTLAGAAGVLRERRAARRPGAQG